MGFFLNDLLREPSQALIPLVKELFGNNDIKARQNNINTVKTSIDTIIKTSIIQIVDISSSITIQNVSIEVKSDSDVIIDFYQTSNVSVSLSAQVAVDVLVDLMIQLNKGTDAYGKILYGHTFTNNELTQTEINEIRTNIKTSISQILNVNDAKLISDLSVTVDNTIFPNILIEPNVTIPDSGVVLISISQNSTININIAAAMSILVELGITENITQEGSVVNYIKPVDDSNILGDFAESSLGLFVIILFFVIILVAIAKDRK